MCCSVLSVASSPCTAADGAGSATVSRQPSLKAQGLPTLLLTSHPTPAPQLNAPASFRGYNAALMDAGQEPQWWEQLMRMHQGVQFLQLDRLVSSLHFCLST